MNNLIKGLSKKAIRGLIFGLALAIGTMAVIAFTEPTSGPAGFDEPTGAEDTGNWLAYGRGWVPNVSGSGSTAITKAACEAATGWEWFEDGNGDGDYKDEEDGICVKTSAISSVSWNGAEQVDGDDDKYDITFIGDWTCTGNFPNGSVVLGSYPSSAGNIALAVADCYDGKRDLLPIVDESAQDSRIVFSGTAESGDDTTLTDNQGGWDDNAWIGQKVKIFAGASAGSEGIISTSTATVLTVNSWSAGNPGSDSQYGIIYIAPWSCYRPNSSNGFASTGNFCNGPLKEEALRSWTGTKLPSHQDFFGFCGAMDGDSDSTAGDSAYHSSGASDNRIIGRYGHNVGRGNNSSPNDEYMYLSNTSWEWLSEQHYYYRARLAGNYACSYFSYYYVDSDYRFRAVFRP